MNIVMGEGIFQRTARCSLALVLATIHDGMTRTSRSCWRWGALIVLAMCFVSPAAAGQDLKQQATPSPHTTLKQEPHEHAWPPPDTKSTFVPVPAKKMPLLKGQPYAQALTTLKEMQLPKPIVTSGPSNWPRGEIYGQSPAPNTNMQGVKVVTLQVSEGPQPKKMPPLIGMPYTNALGILDSMRLPHPSLQYAPSRQPTGVVFNQQPAPNSPLSPDQPITLYISALPPPTMPNLVGQPYTTAQSTLAQQNLPNPDLQYVASDQPAGVVTGQSPIGGTNIQDITAVSLQVSQGPPILVPDVVGSYESAATASIAQRQLRAVHQGDESSSRQHGQVTRTEPVSGTLVQPGTTVAYWLASGNYVVPKLRGDTVDQSQVTLKEAGFRPGGVSYKSALGPTGVVIDQDPKAGSIASMNSPVAITVSEPLPVPPVEGMTPDQAISALNKAGIATVTVVHKFHLAMPNRVFRQDPQPSAAIDPNTKVSLEVPSSTGLAVFAAGLLAGATGIGVGLLHAYQQYLIKITKRLLHIKPSLGPGSETRITHDLPSQIDEPAVALRPRLEEGDVIFDGPISIERQEISHD